MLMVKEQHLHLAYHLASEWSHTPRKRISGTLEIQQQQQTRLFDRSKAKLFWIWNVQEHKQEDIDTKDNSPMITS
jgi:hypothetical protein